MIFAIVVAVAFVTSSSLGESEGVGGAEIVGSGVGSFGGVGSTGGDGGVGGGSIVGGGCGGVGNAVGSAGGVEGTMMNGVALGLGVGGVDVGGAGTPAAVVVARTLASIVACVFGVFVGIIVEVAVALCLMNGWYEPCPIVLVGVIEVEVVSIVGAIRASGGGMDKPCPDDA